MNFNLQLLQKQQLVNQKTALSTCYGVLLCTE